PAIGSTGPANATGTQSDTTLVDLIAGLYPWQQLTDKTSILSASAPNSFPRLSSPIPTHKRNDSFNIIETLPSSATLSMHSDHTYILAFVRKLHTEALGGVHRALTGANSRGAVYIIDVVAIRDLVGR
ncbi:MAG: hypothetical protein CYPHOPRED_005378, partial [Cyphobasidiales sp. Tagirdzhanova-0007]